MILPTAPTIPGLSGLPTSPMVNSPVPTGAAPLNPQLSNLASQPLSSSATSTSPKRFGQIFLGLLVLTIVVVGSVAGYYLVKQQQDVRQRAAGPSSGPTSCAVLSGSSCQLTSGCTWNRVSSSCSGTPTTAAPSQTASGLAGGATQRAATTPTPTPFRYSAITATPTPTPTPFRYGVITATPAPTTTRTSGTGGGTAGQAAPIVTKYANGSPCVTSTECQSGNCDPNTLVCKATTSRTQTDTPTPTPRINAPSTSGTTNTTCTPINSCLPATSGIIGAVASACCTGSTPTADRTCQTSGQRCVATRNATTQTSSINTTCTSIGEATGNATTDNTKKTNCVAAGCYWWDTDDTPRCRSDAPTGPLASVACDNDLCCKNNCCTVTRSGCEVRRYSTAVGGGYAGTRDNEQILGQGTFCLSQTTCGKEQLDVFCNGSRSGLFTGSFQPNTCTTTLQTTPTPIPPGGSTPPGTTPPVGPMCLAISLTNLTNPTAPATADPRLGDAIQLTCGEVAGVHHYIARVIEPNNTIVPLTMTGRISSIYTISQSGNFVAQCQICTSETSCNGYESY